MDRSLFDQLERKYAQHASWAIWKTSDLKDTGVIRENLGDLKTSVVMVALNISGAILSQWQNFHSRDHARKLMYAFNQSPYRGAYMTDLIKDHVESSSERLRQQLLSGHLGITTHLESFHEEMKDLSANKPTLFILFGGCLNKLFSNHLAETYPNRISCPHYSMYGKGYSDAEWVAKVWSTLESNTRVMPADCEAPQFFVSGEMSASLAALRNRSSRSRSH